MKHKPLPLTKDERLKLEEIVRKGADWRSRDRAKTLLLSRGVPAKTVAEAQGVCKKTVHERRQSWLAVSLSGGYLHLGALISN